MKLENNPSLPCFLCGKTVRIKMSKTDRPYFICNVCGLQSFVRYKVGIQKFERLLQSLEDDGEKFLNLNDSNFKTLSLVSRLNELNAKQDKVKQNKSLSDYFLSGSDSELAEDALEKEIKAVRKALKSGRVY